MWEKKDFNIRVWRHSYRIWWFYLIFAFRSNPIQISIECICHTPFISKKKKMVGFFQCARKVRVIFHWISESKRNCHGENEVNWGMFTLDYRSCWSSHRVSFKFYKHSYGICPRRKRDEKGSLSQINLSENPSNNSSLKNVNSNYAHCD